MLFAAEPQFSDLSRRIRERFGGRQATIREIEEYVVAETPYRETHYKRKVLKVMEQAEPPKLEVVSAPPNRHKGNFPEGTVVRFK